MFSGSSFLQVPLWWLVLLDDATRRCILFGFFHFELWNQRRLDSAMHRLITNLLFLNSFDELYEWDGLSFLGSGRNAVTPMKQEGNDVG